MKKILLFVLFLCATLIGPNQPLFAKPAEIGEKRESVSERVPVLILGGGIGALTSALYLARAGVEPIVIEGPNPGGLITQSHSVQNWPGELEISGAELAEKVRKQAEANGAIFSREEAVALDFSKHSFTISLKNLDTQKTRVLTADSVIIAMGTRPNFLGIPGESGPDGYWGRGVSNCAICDGSLYRDLSVGVVGGGDSAILEAHYLSNIASQVNVFVRKDSFKSIVEEKRLQSLLAKPNVKIFYNTSVEEVKGDGANVTGVVLKTSGKTSDFPLDGLFLAIGSKPNSELFKKVLALDSRGYILLKKDQETAIPGVYAIGDIVDPVYKQAISAAGDGAKAALQAQKYISDLSDRETGSTDSTTGSLAQGKSQEKDEGKRRPSKPESLPKSSPASSSNKEVIEITSLEQFQRELDRSEVPVFVDFYASWCGPCKQIYPRIEKSASQLSGRVKFLKVNVDLVDKLPGIYQVRAMPTALLLNHEGHVVDRKVGSDQVMDLLKSLESAN
jgi:thioredoxin reductase (NADPH)